MAIFESDCLQRVKPHSHLPLVSNLVISPTTNSLADHLAGEKLGFLIWYALIFQKVVVIYNICVTGWDIVYLFKDSANKIVHLGIVAWSFLLSPCLIMRQYCVMCIKLSKFFLPVCRVFLFLLYFLEVLF